MTWGSSGAATRLGYSPASQTEMDPLRGFLATGGVTQDVVVWRGPLITEAGYHCQREQKSTRLHVDVDIQAPYEEQVSMWWDIRLLLDKVGLNIAGA